MLSSDKYNARRVDELEGITEFFLRKFPDPAIFILNGSMGAGKTTFISTVCKLLGADTASSPTFSIVNEYHTKAGVKVFHFDLYRIKSLEEAMDFGLEEYLDTRNANWVFIEWPELILPLLENYHTIRINDINGVREIEF
jgi:tRNA threonylcarbamoyladenosine biosynthesis protein TsaE